MRISCCIPALTPMTTCCTEGMRNLAQNFAFVFPVAVNRMGNSIPRIGQSMHLSGKGERDPPLVSSRDRALEISNHRRFLRHCPN
jgi:hypothetical protein